MDLLAYLIGFIPISFAILWFTETMGRYTEERYLSGTCGSLFLFISGASLTGTLKSVFSGNLNTPTLVFFLVTAILSGICFFAWKNSKGS